MRRSQVISMWLWVITYSFKWQVSPSPCFYLTEGKTKCAFSRARGYSHLGSLKGNNGETFCWK